MIRHRFKDVPKNISFKNTFVTVEKPLRDSLSTEEVIDDLVARNILNEKYAKYRKKTNGDILFTNSRGASFYDPIDLII